MWDEGEQVSYYLGIDPSLNNTGCVVVNENKEVVFTTVIHTNIEDNIYLRIKHIEEEIAKIIDEYKPSYVAIENLSFASRGKGMFQLAGLHFLVCLSMVNKNVPFIEVAPTTLKKFVTNSGRARKELMLLQIYKRYGVEFDSSDEADAYGLALMALTKSLEKLK